MAENIIIMIIFFIIINKQLDLFPQFNNFYSISIYWVTTMSEEPYFVIHSPTTKFFLFTSYKW